MEHTEDRLRIGFLSAYSLDEISRWSWSGTFVSMMRALERHCGTVRYVGPMRCPEQAVMRGANRAAKRLLHRNVPEHHSLLLARAYGRIGARLLRERPVDVIVASAGETEIACLDVAIPIVLIEDAPYGALMGYYPEFSHLTRGARRGLDSIEGRALERAAAVVSWSDWAAEAAIQRYGVDSGKVRVVTPGPNLETPPSRGRALARVRRKRHDRCQLLFVGGDWERKGGEIAYETLRALDALGVDAELTVCGCAPPASFTHPRMRVIPFLDARDAGQRRRLENLYLGADLFILPTRGECFGLVFAEAAAFGLPVIATRTGGVASAVWEGHNGALLPPEARGADYAAVIAELWRDRERYAGMARASREVFETRLNWDVWGATMREVIQGVVAAHARDSARGPARYALVG